MKILGFILGIIIIGLSSCSQQSGYGNAGMSKYKSVSPARLGGVGMVKPKLFLQHRLGGVGQVRLKSLKHKNLGGMCSKSSRDMKTATNSGKEINTKRVNSNTYRNYSRRPSSLGLLKK